MRGVSIPGAAELTLELTPASWRNAWRKLIDVIRAIELVWVMRPASYGRDHYIGDCANDYLFNV